MLKNKMLKKKMLKKKMLKKKMEMEMEALRQMPWNW